VSDCFSQVEHCPEFRPSLEEFQDFSGYVEKCISQLGNVMLFKVRLRSSKSELLFSRILAIFPENPH